MNDDRFKRPPTEDSAEQEQAGVEDAPLEELAAAEAVDHDETSELLASDAEVAGADAEVQDDVLEEPTADDTSDETDAEVWEDASRVESSDEDEAAVITAVDAEAAPEADASLAMPQAEAEADPTSYDDFDIDAALAAVGSLADLTATPDDEDVAYTGDDASALEEGADFAARQRRAVSPDDEDVPSEVVEMSSSTDFVRPPLAIIQRGQAASVVPALLLIGVGAWLTLTLTTDGVLPDPPLLLAAAIIGIGVMLLAWWLTMKRWARGSFFWGVLLLAFGGVVAVMHLQALTLSVVWPGLVAAVAFAFLATGLLTRPANRYLTFTGIAGLIAAATAMAVTTDLLDPAFLHIAAELWPVPVAVLVILLIMALLRQRSQ